MREIIGLTLFVIFQASCQKPESASQSHNDPILDCSQAAYIFLENQIDRFVNNHRLATLAELSPLALRELNPLADETSIRKLNNIFNQSSLAKFTKEHAHDKIAVLRADQEQFLTKLRDATQHWKVDLERERTLEELTLKYGIIGKSRISQLEYQSFLNEKISSLYKPNGNALRISRILSEYYPNPNDQLRLIRDSKAFDEFRKHFIGEHPRYHQELIDQAGFTSVTLLDIQRLLDSTIPLTSIRQLIPNPLETWKASLYFLDRHAKELDSPAWREKLANTLIDQIPKAAHEWTKSPFKVADSVEEHVKPFIPFLYFLRNGISQAQSSDDFFSYLILFDLFARPTQSLTNVMSHPELIVKAVRASHQEAYGGLMTFKRPYFVRHYREILMMVGVGTGATVAIGGVIAFYSFVLDDE